MNLWRHLSKMAHLRDSAKIRSARAVRTWPGAVVRVFFTLTLSLAASASAAPLQDAEAIPHLNDRGRAGYRDFLNAPAERAFVIAPGGTWVWRAQLGSEEEAIDAALADCRTHTPQRCVPYAVNDRVVFDAAAWPRLWGPYASRAEARRLPTGTRRGERFPDLAFRSPDGKAMKLSDFAGKIVLLHFWGSWCRPCQQEMPDLQRLYDAVKNDPDIRVVLLPVREDIAQARAWAARLGVRLPIYDAGIKNEADDQFRLANGSRIPDRQIARIFPTTHVIDRHGVVVFSHIGAASRWLDYLPFVRDAAERSGK